MIGTAAIEFSSGKTAQRWFNLKKGNAPNPISTIPAICKIEKKLIISLAIIISCTNKLTLHCIKYFE